MKPALSWGCWRKKMSGPNADWFWIGGLYLAFFIFFTWNDALLAVRFIRGDVAEFRIAGSFRDGRATVNASIDGNWKTCVIDKEGRIIAVNTTYRYNPPDRRDGFGDVAPAEGFSKRFEGKTVGIMTLATGEWVARYQSVGEFRDGMAVAVCDGKAGFVDKTGRWVVEPGVYDNVSPFSNGYARVMAGKAYGYIDTSGRVIIPPVLTSALAFNEAGTAPAGKAGRWGVINRKGEWIVEPSYTTIDEYSEGLAAVRSGDVCGYIDTAGRVTIPLQFAKAASFSEGLAAVKQPDGGWGYIDKSGRWIIKRVKRPSE